MASLSVIIINYLVATLWFLSSIESDLAQSVSDKHCRYDFVATPGIELKDFVIDNMYVSTSQKCALQCLSRSECVSFNFQDVTELCQLNSASLSCVPDHVIFNGTMRHFSPPSAMCWKELCRVSTFHHKPETSPTRPKSNAMYTGPVKATKVKTPLKKSNWTYKSGRIFFIANFLSTKKSRSEFEIHLKGGKYSTEGRIELQHNNKWGVISDKSWDLRDAEVICRQLGFKNGAIKVEPSLRAEARVEPTFVMTDVECSGDENMIDDCKYNIDESVTNQSVDLVDKSAVVVCLSDDKELKIFEPARVIEE